MSGPLEKSKKAIRKFLPGASMLNIDKISEFNILFPPGGLGEAGDLRASSVKNAEYRLHY